LSTVVDSSVLVAALVDTGPHGAWAERVLAGGSLHAPELARAEATSIFRRLERAKLITTPEANAAQRDELRRVVRRPCRSAQAPARNSGRTSFEIKRSHLQVPDAWTLKSCAGFDYRARWRDIIPHSDRLQAHAGLQRVAPALRGWSACADAAGPHYTSLEFSWVSATTP
jgi:predicted nucleic acid-binding protein